MEQERKRILKLIEEGKLSAEEAEELLQALEDAEQVKEKGDKTQSSIPGTVVYEDEGQNRQESTHSTRQSSTKEKIFDFIDATVEKIKKTDFDFNFGPYKQVSHIFQYPNTSISSFLMDIENGSVEVQTWDEPDIRIECKAKVYKVDNQEQAKEMLLKELSAQVESQQLKVILDTKKMKADFRIWIPEHIYQASSIKIFNGSINLRDLNVPELKVKTSNGKINLQNMTGEKWDIKSVNSNIRAENVTGRECEIETLNGSIYVDGEWEEIESQVINGSIKGYLRGMETKNAYFKSTTGSISLFVPTDKSVDGELKSSIGNVQCYLPNHRLVSSEKEVLKKSMHFETDGNTPTLYLEAETKTGKVNVNPLN
ncbi:DUF4097 and DUF4098 domain-containing protein YvlB [Salinibacillus kushneri]|uniref:DUF4097 and DUF4098 domain-containing protein YvlB n=1 Tax=Salinibacillus kushneri TaxID=237682 RepID=A0A1H9YQ07_9BACI|nr:DUF4097 domain-containing protein [Salinibacillus kushneri]SES70567.1 DUF4097 and DUF4098 domain-containing protein YvlB [Salinibacillus kushneri]